MPEGWVANENGRLADDLSGRTRWENGVDLVAPDGTQLVYYDGFGSGIGFVHTDFGLVEQLPLDVQVVGGEPVAASWWVQDSGRWFVYAGVATLPAGGTEPVPQLTLPGVERNHTLGVLLLGDDQPTVGSEAEARQLLESPAVREALRVMTTLELTGVDASAMPPGVQP